MLDLPEDGQRREVRHSALDELHGVSGHARRGPEEALRLRGAEGSGDTGEGHDEKSSNEDGEHDNGLDHQPSACQKERETLKDFSS